MQWRMTETSTIRRADAAAIEEAAALLRAGALVAFPTETVYGLGADATNGLAVARIFEAKGRPRFNPLIVHVANLDEAERLAELDDRSRQLARRFWPGPLTLVLGKRPDCPVAELATSGLETVALRVPAHPIARSLLEFAGVPIAAPSANRSGHVSPTTAQHVAADLGGAVAMILDGGPAEHGLESSIVDARGRRLVLLRLGAVTRGEIEAAAGETLETRLAADELRPSAPGQLESHYAPRAAVRPGATSVAGGEALLAFGSDVPAHEGPMINLSPSGDLREAAANLFAALRALDRPGVSAIAVVPIPGEGLGEAINDRLRRAAAPRG
jgi:L-threonylcarbamoyladenylate synthase